MKTQSAIKYALLFISVLLTYLIVLFVSDEVLIDLTFEDHMFEWIGTLFLLASSVLFFIRFLNDKNGNDFYLFKTNKNYFFFFLSLLFFFAFGEEISWGQRLFNIQTPEVLKRINYQDETNIHNLKIFIGLLDQGRLFNYFWITFCLIIPLLNWKSAVSAKFFNKINMPIVPLWLALTFFISYSIYLVFDLSYPKLFHAISELKETSLSSLFLVYGVFCLSENHH